MNTNQKSNVYFPSLNGLRFIAAAIVFVFHFAKQNWGANFGYDPKANFIYWSVLGDIGVTLFFVLSGFLITYLLLAEQERTSTINITKFYIRRALRIWPLYFAIIVIVAGYEFWFGRLDTQFIYTKLILYVFFMPNVACIIFSSGGLPSHLWSVGSEEQFYFVYPALVKYAKQHIIKLLVAIPVLFIALRTVLEHIISTHNPVLFKGINVFNFLLRMTNALRIDSMLIGGLFAWLLFNQHSLLKMLYSKTTQLIVYAAVVILIAVNFSIPQLQHTVYSLLFGAITLNLASNKDSVLNLEYPVFNRLGTLSYSIYMFHSLTFTILMDSFNLNGTVVTIAICFVVSFIMTILLSHLSYTYLEQPFLKFKHKFSIVTSGNDAKKHS